MSALAPLVPRSVERLGPFVDAGVFGATEVHLAAAVARLRPGVDPDVLLAVAVAARAPQLGHVGLEITAVDHRLLDRLDQDRPDLPWPLPEPWGAVLAASDAVAETATAHLAPLRPLVWDGRRIYLHRYWHHEQAVAGDLLARGRAPAAPLAGRDELTDALDRLFPPATGATDPGPDFQRLAAAHAVTDQLTVVGGGPGTGKTRTIARLLAVAHHLTRHRARPLAVALAAPTGKAAARMTEAVALAVTDLVATGAAEPAVIDQLHNAAATTIHRLLGARPDGTFRHHDRDRLAHDLVVVDETSMVSLPLMAHLLEAVRPDARLVLVGDPDQLVSVEAGTVLGDIVGPARRRHPEALDAGSGGSVGGPAAENGPLVGSITILAQTHRFGTGSGIGVLADTVRHGDADAAIALLRADGSGTADGPDGADPTTDLAWVTPTAGPGLAAVTAEVTDAAVATVEAARAGDADASLRSANSIKLLAATRHGANGLYDWTSRIEAVVSERVPSLGRTRGSYVGRPVLVTANDPRNRLANGDVGVTLAGPGGDGLVVALQEGAGHRLVAASRLAEVETWWAMTIHKSQGSEFDHVVVALPDRQSPVLSRELLYTAITRARHRLTVVATEASLRQAVTSPVARASGLGDLLWPPHPTSLSPPLGTVRTWSGSSTPPTGSSA